MGKFGNRVLPEFMEKAFEQDCEKSGETHYNYWNEFVETWCRLTLTSLTATTPVTPATISGWSNPNTIPLLNSAPAVAADYSMKYIPEPWWGHTGNYKQNELHSVVVNFNPGRASGVQNHHDSSGLFGNPDYQQFIHREVDNFSSGVLTNLPGTNDWHFTNRAKPIFDALADSGAKHNWQIVFSNSDFKSLTLHNHLSVELIPWHTPGVGTIPGSSGSVFDYINLNLGNTFLRTLLFAASRSRCINNSVLQNTVILRLGKTYIRDLLKKLKKAGLIKGFYEITYINLLTGPHPATSPSGNGAFLRFTIDHPDLLDITFVSIWRPKRDSKQNNFPDPDLMKWIFENIV